MVKIKGHEIEAPKIQNTFSRRAVQIQNKIILTLKQIGVERHSTSIPLEAMAQRKASASATWYFEGRNLKYTYSLMPKFVENLYIIDKVLEIEVDRLLSKKITADQFIHEFSEDDNHSEQLLEARKTLGMATDEMDFEVISKKYKDLAKKYHPDMPEGDHKMFQKINATHKLIKKELM